jgi:predicted nucleic acid-binding protein
MAWLLDTNILSEGRKPRPEPRVIAFYDTQPLDQLYISIVNIAEIRFGIELQEDPRRRAELNDWLMNDTAARVRRAHFADNGRHPAQMAAVDGRRAQERAYLFTPGSFSCSDSASARAYRRHTRPERF